MRRLGSAAPFVALLCAGPVQAQSLTADEALERYRKTFQPVAGTPCRRGGADGEIVVCARPDGPDPNRLPLPVQPLPGSREVGEPADPLETSKVGTEECTTVGPHGSCSFIPIHAIAVWAVKTAIKAVKAAKED